MIRMIFLVCFVVFLQPEQTYLLIWNLGGRGENWREMRVKIVALDIELTQIWWQDGEEGCRSQCGQAQNQGITWLLLQIQRRVILSLLPAMHMMYPVSIITTIKNLFTRWIIIIIIIFKEKKEEEGKNQRNLDSNTIYSSCTINLKLMLQWSLLLDHRCMNDSAEDNVKLIAADRYNKSWSRWRDFLFQDEGSIRRDSWQ